MYRGNERVKEKITVLISDDNFEFAKTLSDYLDKDEEIQVVGMAKDGEEAIDQRHQKRAEQTGKKRNHNGEERIHGLDRGLVEEPADDARNGTDIHDSGNPEVQVPRFFRNNFTGRAEEKRRALQDRAL